MTGYGEFDHIIKQFGCYWYPWQCYNRLRPIDECRFSLEIKPNTIEDKPITQLILNDYKIGE